MKVLFSKNLIFTFLFVLAITFVGMYFSLRLTQGNFTYALDDTYIHMSVAKNLVERGLWSVDGNSKSSPSSSPLWVLILAFFYKVLGKDIFLFVPFALNIIFILLSLFQIFKFLKKHLEKDLNFIFGILISLIIPSVALIFGGMEHSFHIFLLIMFLNNVLSYFKNPTNNNAKKKIVYLAPFLVLVRYESIALIFAFCLLSIIYLKDWKFSLKTFISSLVLVVCFGLISKFFLDSGFIPNPIQAKSFLGKSQGILSTLVNLTRNLYRNFFELHIAGIYILNVAILVKSVWNKDKTYFLFTLLFILSFFLHLTFGMIGWLFRYEAYMVAFGILNAMVYFTQYFKLSKHWYLVVFIILPFFSKLMLYSPYMAIIGTKNIYEQQRQMAKFLQENCNTCSVAANDIGAITYYTNIKLLDLIGLGNNDVLELRNKRQFTNDKINKLLAKYNTELIIIYEHWFEGVQFENFTKIGEWRIRKNYVCGGETVSFFSRNDVIEKNITKFKNFTNSKLPKTVIYRICETNSQSE